MEGSNRREFLGRFFPKLKVGSDLLSDPVTDSIKDVTRRTLLKTLTGIFAATAVFDLSQVVVSAQAEKLSHPDHITPCPVGCDLPQRSDGPVVKDTYYSFSRTALEQSFLLQLEILFTSALDKLRIPNGNKAVDVSMILKELKADQATLFFDMVIRDPLVEEFIFRALPSRTIAETDDSCRWDIGLPVSFIFALLHCRSETGFKSSVPLQQFMGGLYCWYLMRTKGFLHAFFAHAMMNAICFEMMRQHFKFRENQVG